MKKPKPAKPYWEMNLEELRESTKEFDKPLIIDTFTAMTPAARAAWNRAKRKRGRPRIGEGAEVVSVSIERGLLTRSDKLARKLKVSRARLIAAGLERLLNEQPRRSSAKTSVTGEATRRKRRKAA